MKIGDIIICIDNVHRHRVLTQNKEYRLYDTDRFGMVWVTNDVGEIEPYLGKRFSTKEEIRKQRIENLL